MQDKQLCRAASFSISDVALECVMAYLDDPRDRCAVSLVCKKWYRVDVMTRKHVTVAMCYSTTPQRLANRFPCLESLKLKGKPRAAMFNLIPQDWGGYAVNWVNEIAERFCCLKSIHFRRMVVTDEDISVLVRGRGHMLQSLKLDKCSGFSTDGLMQIAGSCRSLRVLLLEESIIEDKGNHWIRELAVNNSVLEVLNFHLTQLSASFLDIELLAKNCPSLTCFKASDSELLEILEFEKFLKTAALLEDFGGGSFNSQAGELDKYQNFKLPQKLTALVLNFIGKDDVPVIYPCSSVLKKLDLQYAFLDTDDHCQLLQRCPNLEILEVRNVIGDVGLEVVAQHCKKLKRLRVERGEDEHGLEDELGMVSHRGLSALAQGCLDLQYLAVYVSDINNGALECIGTYSKNLCDFRLVLLDHEEHISDLPLDNGVRALLIGCQKLKRFAFYLRAGGLTDIGLSYIGRYSNNIRWMLLGFVGETDLGLLEFSRGCPKLEKLEMRGCSFTDHALSLAVLQLVSLKYMWVQGYTVTPGANLLRMARPFWNIEIIPSVDPEQPSHILAYYSLAGRRTDRPDTIISLLP